MNSMREASFLYKAKTRMRASEEPVVVVFLCERDRRREGRRVLHVESEFAVTCHDRERHSLF